jgi:hypothetical protein
MPKVYDIPTAAAANYLTLHARVKNWIYGLDDNRNGRALQKIGKIPSKKVKGRVYYNKKDLESVAEAIIMHDVFEKPYVKLFK